jgi:hypothetical protein
MNPLQFGTWEVTTSGDLFDNESGYYIHGERIQEQDWILHAIVQKWDLNTFIPAFYEAVRINKLTQIVYNIDYL